jgi:rhodanese-related sulfurtransferase
LKGKKLATEVTIDDLERAIAAGEFVVDVRESFEFEAGHVPGAHHIALNTIPDHLEKFPKGAKVWIICQSGGRSMTAANYLDAQGFEVVSVAGGTGGWINAGKEVSFEESK